MKNSTPPLISRLLLALLLLWSGLCQAQQRPMIVVYDENNQPYIQREIIVRFDPAVMRFAGVDNPALQAGHLSDFLSATATEQLSQKLGYNAAQIETFKIFGAMTSADTLSIDRLGETIRLDNHWASLVLQLPAGSAELSVCNTLNTLFPLVRYAHRNLVFTLDQPATVRPCPTGAPNDPEYLNGQASLHPTTAYPNGNINAPSAWLQQTGQNFIKVGVVDTGIDAAHPDFNNGSVFGPVVTAGFDFFNNLPRLNIQDNNGHGTACAGIIGAQRNNASGIAGIAGGSGGQYGVQLVDLKVSQVGLSALSAVVRALVEGSSQAPASSGFGYRVNVLNNSFGRYLSGTQPANGATYTSLELSELRNAVRTAYRNKVTIVCARGNLSVSTPTFPASFPDDWVLSVGASDENGNKANFSNFGDNVDLIAPGVSPLVLTTQSQQTGSSSGAGLYTTFNGTSAAAPHVSGVAALLLSSLNSTTSLQNNLAPEDVEQILQRTAKDKGTINASAPYDDQTGWGLLDAGAAIYKSRPGPYRLVHDRLTTSTATVTNNVRVQLLSAYASGATTLAAGIYTADRYRVVGTFSPRASLVQPSQQILGVWARNGSTNLWSGVNPLDAEAGVRVVTWDQNTAVAEGYTYFIKYDVAGRAVNRWAPYDPTSTSQGIMDVTYYTYDSFQDIYFPCRAANEDPKGAGPQARAYPNPAGESVAISYELPTETNSLEMEISNISGQVLHKQRIQVLKPGAQSTTVSLKGLASGFYFFRLVSDAGVQTGKFIKQ